MQSSRRRREQTELGLRSALQQGTPPGQEGERRAAVEITLEIVSAGQTVRVLGRSVDRVELEMMPWGLRGELQFWVDNDQAYGGEDTDALYKPFCARDPMTVTLSLAAQRSDVEIEARRGRPPIKPFVVSGLVFEREVFEEVPVTSKKAALGRCYRVAFADPAHVHWLQHHPVELYTDKSLQEVIEANKTAAIKVMYEGEPLKQKRPQLFLGLSEEQGTQASFYDWLLWWCDRQDLLWSYSYSQGTYRLADKPADVPKQRNLVSRRDVGRIFVRHLEAPRIGARVRSATSADPRTSPIRRKEAQAPLSRDVLLRPAVGADFEARAKLESARLRGRAPLVFLDFRALPLRMIGPGDWIDVTKDAALFRAHGLVLPELALKESLRCTRVSLSLVAEGERGQGGENGRLRQFSFEYAAQFEAGSERAAQLPLYVTPQYPRMVEGLLLAGAEQQEGAKSGSKEVDEIYELEKQEQTALLRYRVKLPVFGNQIVRCPFDPGSLSGHFYFPLYKGARVLVALECERATVRAMLDWRIGGQLPLESQGNQLMMGKKPSSQVILRSAYVDEKIVFTLQRTSGEDVQTVRLSEGELRVFVGEGKDEKAADKIKTTEIVISKSKGVRLKVEDPSAKCSQEVTIDGKSIAQRVTGEKEKTSIVQTEDALRITAKDVSITGETLTIKSKKPSSWTCEETLALRSKGALSIGTEASLDVKASDAATVDAASLALTAKREASLDGMNTTVKAKKKLSHQALRVAIEGKASSSVKAASVEVNGTTAVTVKSSAVAKLDGSLVKVSGSLIQIG